MQMFKASEIQVVDVQEYVQGVGVLVFDVQVVHVAVIDIQDVWNYQSLDVQDIQNYQTVPKDQNDKIFLDWDFYFGCAMIVIVIGFRRPVGQIAYKIRRSIASRHLSSENLFNIVIWDDGCWTAIHFSNHNKFFTNL